MPIDSIASLRQLSQAQGSFVRLDQGTDKLQATTVKARFWQWSQRSQEKAGNRAAAERVRDSVCAYCGKAEGTRLFNQYIGKKSLEGKAFTGAYLMANGLEIPYTHSVEHHKQNAWASRVLLLTEEK